MSVLEGRGEAFARRKSLDRSESYVLPRIHGTHESFFFHIRHARFVRSRRICCLFCLLRFFPISLDNSAYTVGEEEESLVIEGKGLVGGFN